MRVSRMMTQNFPRNVSKNEKESYYCTRIVSYCTTKGILPKKYFNVTFALICVYGVGCTYNGSRRCRRWKCVKLCQNFLSLMNDVALLMYIFEEGTRRRPGRDFFDRRSNAIVTLSSTSVDNL